MRNQNEMERGRMDEASLRQTWKPEPTSRKDDPRRKVGFHTRGCLPLDVQAVCKRLAMDGLEYEVFKDFLWYALTCFFDSVEKERD